jgi:hypothetical protein
MQLDHTLALLRRLDLQIRREMTRARLIRGQRSDEEYRRLDRIGELFGLSAFERDVLLVCLAAEFDLKYERLFAYLQDDVTKKRPTVDLALRLLCSTVADRVAARAAFQANAPLLLWELITINEDPGARRPVLLARYLKLDDRIAAYLLGSEPAVAPAASPETESAAILPARIREQLAAWCETWPWHTAERAPVVLLHGRYGTGQAAAAEHLACSLGQGLIRVDLAGPVDVPLARRLMLGERDALLSNAVLCCSGVEALLNPEPGQEADYRLLTRALAEGRVPTVLLAERGWEPGRALRRRPFLRLELTDPTHAERAAIWTDGLAGSSALTPDELGALASRFRLSPGQIQDAIARARTLAWSRDPTNGHVSPADIDAACRVQAQHRLGALARKLIPRYRWDDIVLPPAQLTTLRLIAAMIRQRSVVYGEWGFDRKLAMGKGVIALFAGPSGTGKTMAAEILSHDLGLDLYRIDLSSVVNKYIGETEKNLERLFSEAQESDAILFFDEADALFGKRSGVSDAHDRYANIETAYLLQRTEEYNGLVILASNLPKNMDDAFVRRIHFTVNFPAPEEPERLQLWERAFPVETPRAPDLDLAFLARQLKIAGGNIRNIVLAAAFIAAEERKPISMRHLVRAAGYEFQKMGKMLLESDFGPYLDLARAPGTQGE